MAIISRFSSRTQRSRNSNFRRVNTLSPRISPSYHAGPTPHISTRSLEIHDRRWQQRFEAMGLESFRELPTETITVDLHCVTRWSKLNTSWEGVSLDVLIADLKTDFPYAMFRSYGDYTTNLPLKDVMNKQAWIAFKYNGADLEPEHGGPARLLVPHLYLWKHYRTQVKGMTLMPHDKPGFWENLGYHIYGDPWQEQRYSNE